ncbi:MAG: o-succinylbenzoate synthase [Chloroflexaceae bacterium]|nr:o-succinylbenzoate synthase [Chloroflexaceae bacterium]
MTIEQIELHLIEMPLVHPFETSFGRETVRPCILVSVASDGLIGWGECVAGSGPWYASETVQTAWHVLRDYLIGMVLGQPISAPQEVPELVARVRGHAMARAALENAIWDLVAQAQGVSLATLLGGTRAAVPVGVSVGLEPTIAALLAQVEGFVARGYQRVKLKIKPGQDVQLVRAVRERYPDLLLQVDANSAYTLADTAVFKELDAYQLLLIEQPLHHDDLVDHATLQHELHTPICLDESIQSPEHARWALQLGACRVINIKVGRVGGFTAAMAIHDLCAAQGVPVWCGGMLETNIGRAGNLALASTANFTLPGDISESVRYFAEDVALPNLTLNSDSTITVPDEGGLGVTLDAERLAAVRQQHLVVRASGA